MRALIIYGVILGALLILMSMARYRLLFMLHSESLYTGFIALVCCGAGLWAGLSWHRKMQRREALQAVVEPVAPKTDTESALLTPREMAVLQLIADGLSNQEIAESLFVSLNTVKTHSANIFSKLDVRRRTQAIQKAKSLGLLP